jgi:colicin import membrane protein
MPMTPVAATGAPYRVPPEPNRWPSIALAAAMHAGLLAFLFIGVNWQNTAPVAVEAEVWDMKTQAAAPPPPEVAEPAPAPAPEPKPVEPAPLEKPAAPKPPDIALAREKRKAEQRKLLEEERREENKLEEAKLARELKAQKKAEQLAEKKAQELADKKAAEADTKLAEKKLAEKKLADKLKADKLAKAKSEAAEQAKLDKVRADEMRRITAGAGTSGEAAKSSASHIDTGYLASITSKIKSTTSYAGSTDVAGNPKAIFKVEELPTGEIISVKLVKSSGIAAFDEAVERGINKASPLPKKKDGTVARTVEVAFSMKDLN